MLLQMVENGIKAKDLNNNKTWYGRYIINMYIDGNRIAATGYEQYADHVVNSDLSLRATLNNDDNEPNIGNILYKNLKTKLDLLTPGKHKLKIEYVPYDYKFDSNLEFQACCVR